MNLSELLAPRSDHSRMAFLSEYPDDEQALVRIVSPNEGLEVSLGWNAEAFPYAWYWMEAGGRKGFPWYSDAYVLAIEPASSWPAQPQPSSRPSAVARSTNGASRDHRSGYRTGRATDDLLLP